mmetsp:Transcript_158085/g.507189  ORF Transcript_158085/g.507189 Transcript_158085/m.507189 type:complete len:419 (+) Transcript_158085:492-1748(+)
MLIDRRGNLRHLCSFLTLVKWQIVRGKLLFGRLELPSVQEGDVAEGDGSHTSLSVLADVDAIEEQVGVACPSQFSARVVHLLQTDGAAVVLIQLLEASQDTPEVHVSPLLEGVQNVEALGIVFLHADHAGHFAVEHPPASAHVAVELEAAASVPELDPGEAVRVVAIQKQAPSPEQVPVVLLQEGLQFFPLLKFRLRSHPLQRVPAVEPHQVAALDCAEGLEVEALEDEPPHLLVGKVWPAQLLNDGSEGGNCHGLLREPDAGQSPGDGRGIRLSPDGLTRAEALAGPLLELRQGHGLAHVVVVKVDNTIVVLVQAIPNVLRIHLEIMSAAVAPQALLRDLEGGGCQAFAPGADVVAEGAAHVLLELVPGQSRSAALLLDAEHLQLRLHCRHLIEVSIQPRSRSPSMCLVEARTLLFC